MYFESRARNQVIMRDAPKGSPLPRPIHFHENKVTGYGDLDTASDRTLKEVGAKTSAELDEVVMATEMFKIGFPNGIWKREARESEDTRKRMAEGEAAGYTKFSDKMLKQMLVDIQVPFPATAPREKLIELLVLAAPAAAAKREDSGEKTKRGS